MITNQILKTLLDNASLSENDGLTFKDIQQCLTEDFSVKVLQSMRADGLINNAMKKNLNVWWLTAKGADMALVNVETMQTICEPEPQCPASVGGNIDPDMDDSMLNDVALPEAPEHDSAVVANQHTDAFINATNESKKPIEVIEFIVIDENEHVVQDGFETISDAIHKAHELAAVGGEYHVERISTRRMGSAKPVTTTQWVAA
jgi:hypothetical protein